MRTQLLPKVFTFAEEDRGWITLSDPTKIQLDSVLNVVSLVPDDSGRYPLDTGLYVMSKATAPGAWKSWYMLLVGVLHKYVAEAAVTSHRVRLHDGTNHKFWSGTAWVTAGATDWNTEADINAHIATFPSRTLRVVVNLSTTDRRYTPQLHWVKLAWNGVIYFWEDIIYRSLVRSMKAAIRSLADFPIDMPATASTINLNSFPLDSGFDITDVDSVFNNTLDPDHLNDLKVSYNPGTKVITLSGSIAAGNRAWVRFLYKPKVVVIQGQDYKNLAAVPTIVLEDFHEVGSRGLAFTDGVFDRATGRTVLFHPPYYTDLRFAIIGLSPTGVDALRMNEDVLSYFENNPMLVSQGLDEQYRVQILSEFEDTSDPSLSGVRTSKVTAEIKGVLSYLRPAETEASGMSPVRRIRLVGDLETDIPVTP